MARRTLGRLDFGVFERLRLGWRLLRDPRVATGPKLLVPLAILYVLSPIDVLPDFIPLLGQVDDISVIGITLAVVAALVRWSPQDVVAEHAAELGYIERFDEPFERRASARGGQQEPIEATYWVDDWR